MHLRERTIGTRHAALRPAQTVQATSIRSYAPPFPAPGRWGALSTAQGAPRGPRVLSVLVSGQAAQLGSPAVSSGCSTRTCPENPRKRIPPGATWTSPSDLSRRDRKRVRASENVAAGNFLGPGVFRRLNTFRLLVGQGQGAVRNDGCACALSNCSKPDAAEAI